jgi:MoaA/NifB/PqqE/SkfB family radical SAM enzyme
MKIRPVGAELFHADGQTDMAKLVAAFLNLANAPKVRLIVTIETTGKRNLSCDVCRVEVHQTLEKPQDKRANSQSFFFEFILLGVVVTYNWEFFCTSVFCYWCLKTA